VRVHLWMRTVEAVDAGGVTAEVLAGIEGALASWPARSRAAWGGWYADVEVTEATGYDDPGRHIFRFLGRICGSRGPVERSRRPAQARPRGAEASGLTRGR
jgi:hypothetical protein